MSQFQLFPPPSPEAKVPKNPFRKGAVRKPTTEAEPASPIPLEEMKNNGNTEAVVLQVTEDVPYFPPPHPGPPPRARIARNKSPILVSTRGSDSPQSARSRSRQDNTSSHPLPSERSLSTSNGSIHTDASTTSPQSSHSSISPVPMRSMFPQFDPSIPLNQQIGRPQVYDSPQPAASPASTKKARRPKLTINPASNSTPVASLTSSTNIDQVLGPKTVPASVLNFPTGVLEPEEVQYSSAQELGTLWEAANGQRPERLSNKINLRLTRTGPAGFAFGNSDLPFYTLQTYSNNELAISRSAPSNPENAVPIMTLILEDRIRREHPNDGLVSLLFSRLAAMMAIEQADEISKQHHLSPSDSRNLESQALKRAAAEESCRLSWNRHLRLYELRHPSLSKRTPPALVGAAGIPLSPVRSKSSGLLHITVSAPSSGQPPTVLVTGPVSSVAMEAAQEAANPRTSTLPVADSEEPLASLDFATRTLSISPAAVIATIPSLYAVDSLVAAMLAVAVSDEATNPIMADMELGTPRSTSTGPAPEPAYGAPFQGKLITTLAEREDYAESGFFSFWNHSKSEPKKNQRKSKKSKKTQQIIVEEFDLEKYGRYGSGSSREGQELPGITRGLLGFLFFGLNVIVKLLTLMVRILAWVLVHSTRCVTSEKF
ncbi:hypothetical protein N7468_004626 [Penicillium chermesinum]|uniref:Uncharacterized protein n=1 Tax=Penicillium chermesinum TaxID=63820 RepID=A0A9W9TSX9_9EURO|nr:uncharacterized protein N7468_004626 [Penicillium chermesinum]KAJ5240007.1 hypothetical protein N7468_004626 [Penicillium chermesinum]